jgi:hypothetical protein
MVSEICKAKDPRTCPYHGTVLTMYTAQINGDFNAYHEARTKLEGLRGSWNEDGRQELLEDVKLPAPSLEKVNGQAAATTLPTGATAPTAPTRKETTIANANDPEIQGGKVVDTLNVQRGKETVTFYRSTAEVAPIEPQYIRLQASRKLSTEDVTKMAGLLGYAYRVCVIGGKGEKLGMPGRDTPYSFIVHADTTKSNRDDLADALGNLETRFRSYAYEGSPERRSQNNTRAIEGFQENDMRIEIYYDSALPVDQIIKS